MNEFLDDRFVERVDRLLLGIEPRDAKRNMRVAQPVEIAVEGPQLSTAMKRALRDEGRVLTDTMRRMARHASCRYVLLYETPPKDHVIVRVIDRFQRFVPRRLKIPLPVMAHPDDPAELDTIEAPPATPVGTPTGRFRVRRPQLFPGAAYDLSEQSTGLRGRVVREDPVHAGVFHPARWARVEATRGGSPIGSAHADHRGEFLLLIDAKVPGQLPADLVVTVTAHAPLVAPAPPSALDADVDPLWDLPLETLANPGVVSDTVSDGTATPATYDGSATQDVHFQFGVLRSLGVPPFQIT